MIDISIGTGSIKTDPLGYSTLIEFYDKCRQQPDRSDILIDFNSLDWIDANMSALIVGILKKLENERAFTFYIDPEDIRSRFGILITNGFVTGIELVPRENRSALALTGFDVNEASKFITYIKDSLLSHPSLSIDDLEKDGLLDSLFELYSNIQKHALTNDPCFVCGQYFPDRKLLHFTLVDLGIGYLPPIRAFTKGKVKSSKSAILWALKAGNTTKVGTPGGLGLQWILDFCEKRGAIFEIITGNTYWSSRKEKPKTIKQFCGTTVNVIFDCNP